MDEKGPQGGEVEEQRIIHVWGLEVETQWWMSGDHQWPAQSNRRGLHLIVASTPQLDPTFLYNFTSLN
ncbi:hypothetical protein PIB30_060360 [Stylosanthes scabra]|uniref:Uncharacterized protein n=1 Tax=Stylosanthes scabra TaxID=79078 RepID=A0ABU6RLE5_9FABA|nr:hypothetical protein [Stylosanthes scabra]